MTLLVSSVVIFTFFFNLVFALSILWSLLLFIKLAAVVMTMVVSSQVHSAMMEAFQ